MPCIEVDPAKDAINREKHGITLHRFVEMDFERALSAPATTVAGEERWMFIGTIGVRLYVAIVTFRGEITRVISLRPASRKERQLYGQTR